MKKRDIGINIRVTQDEKATLEQKAIIADESLSSFVRKISLGYTIKPPKEVGIIQGDQLDLFSSLSDDERAILSDFENSIDINGRCTSSNELNLKVKMLISRILDTK